MEAQTKHRTFHRFVNLKNLLVVLSLLYFLLLTNERAYAVLNHSWPELWWRAFLTLAAACSLWYGKGWSYLLAIAFGAAVIYPFVIEVLGILNVIQPRQGSVYPPFGGLWSYIKSAALEVHIPLIIAALTLIHAMVSLGRALAGRRAVLP